MGQYTLCTSTGLPVKVLVVDHSHLSYPRMTFANPTKSAIITFNVTYSVKTTGTINYYFGFNIFDCGIFWVV